MPLFSSPYRKQNSGVYPSVSGKGIIAGRGAGSGGLGKTHSGGKTRVNLKRHRKILKDNIRGITKPAIRRVARRGGVKRISAQIYDDTRSALKTFLEGVSSLFSNNWSILLTPIGTEGLYCIL